MTDPWIFHNILKYKGDGMTSVNDEFERTWKDIHTSCFTVPSQLPVQIEENHTKPQVGCSQRTYSNPESLKQDAVMLTHNCSVLCNELNMQGRPILTSLSRCQSLGTDNIDRIDKSMMIIAHSVAR